MDGGLGELVSVIEQSFTKQQQQAEARARANAATGVASRAVLPKPAEEEKDGDLVIGPDGLIPSKVLEREQREEEEEAARLSISGRASGSRGTASSSSRTLLAPAGANLWHDGMVAMGSNEAKNFAGLAHSSSVPVGAIDQIETLGARHQRSSSLAARAHSPAACQQGSPRPSPSLSPMASISHRSSFREPGAGSIGTDPLLSGVAAPSPAVVVMPKLWKANSLPPVIRGIAEGADARPPIHPPLLGSALSQPLSGASLGVAAGRVPWNASAMTGWRQQTVGAVSESTTRDNLQVAPNETATEGQDRASNGHPARSVGWMVWK